MKPFIEQRADPHILRKDGFYYFTASVPAFDRVILRKADSLQGLAQAEEKTVWTRHESGEMSCNIWAPEIHNVDGAWVIYFAAARGGADSAGCYDHRTYALINRNDDPMEGGFEEALRSIPRPSCSGAGAISSGPSGILISQATATCISRR